MNYYNVLASIGLVDVLMIRKKCGDISTAVHPSKIYEIMCLQPHDTYADTCECNASAKCSQIDARNQLALSEKYSSAKTCCVCVHIQTHVWTAPPP